ncbi:MAG: GspE/PulE family protein [Candidatus Nealsonbacteria bacterium]|nr:GspE/PulE family protein [Candidatus Nealsonbacteria bacterium]
MTLIQSLVKEKILDKKSAASFEYEIKNSGQKEEEFILSKKIVEEKLLFEFKSKNLKIPIKEPVLEDITLELLKLIPEDSANFYSMVPLSKKEKTLEIGMVYPEDLKAQEAVKFLARRQKISYKIFLITITSFREVLKKYKNLRKEVTRALEELEVELESEKTTFKVDEEELMRLVEEAPISKVVAVIVRHAVEGGASDVHIEPGRENSRVRFRLDGVLHASLFVPSRIHPAVVARIKILSKLKLDETRVPQDGRFSAQIGEDNIDFRVSTFPTNFGEKVVIRVLNPKTGMRTLEQIGFIPENCEKILKAINKPYGMILATGPTGCGKTTTLYAILRILNDEEVNIVTLEDPIEYFLPGINQSQTKPEIGYDFASGLRSIVRQDPDVIMVGEIRDKETASLSVHAALTGHIVLSTLHTNSASGVVPRFIDLGIESYLIPSSLSLAIAQRLVRRLCPECKEAVKPAEEAKKMILREIERLPEHMRKKTKINPNFTIFKPKGCKKCGGKGYSGRVAIVEILEMTDQLAELTLKRGSEAEVAEEAKRQGMITMRQDGILKVLSGETSIEEVIREASEI